MTSACPEGAKPGGRYELYVPMPARLPELPILVRTTMPEREVVASMRRVVADFDRTLRAESGRPFGAILRELTVGDTYVSDSLAPTRFAMALLAAFSARRARRCRSSGCTA